MTEDLNNYLREKKYLLYHYYEYGEDNEYEEIKVLGIYSSKEKASKAAERYFKLEGFKNYPRECFEIEEFIVDEDSAWKEGFVSSREIEQDFENLTICFNRWLGIAKNARDSWQDQNYYNTLCEINTKVYKIDNVMELAKCIQQIWKRNFDDKDKKIDDYISIAADIIRTLKSN